MEGHLRISFGDLLSFGNTAKLGIDRVVEGRGLVAREGSVAHVAGERILAEHSLVTAGKGELSCLDDGAGVVFNGQADVENL